MNVGSGLRDMLFAYNRPLDDAKPRFSIAVHGGAGNITREGLDPDREKAARECLEQCLFAAKRVLLEEGGSALDAAIAAVMVMEDSPAFNAGKGSVLASDGCVYMDTTVMDGATLKAGAMCGIKHIKNPVLGARLVMDATHHVFLFGEDAEALAQAHNLEVVSEDYFHTEYRTEQWRRVKDAGTVQLDSDPLPSKGTVGCVVRDPKGNIAAATSTGGMVNKRPGRVGDSAVIGAGTYANNATCAVSGTGNGEEFIRHHVGARLSDLMELGGFDMLSAAEKIVFEELTQGTGGLIAVDREGNIAMPFSSSGMFRAWMKEDAEPHVAIFRDE